MTEAPEGVEVVEDLHRVRVPLRGGADPLLVGLGTGVAGVLAALVLGQLGTVWPLAAVLVATAVLLPGRRSQITLDAAAVVVERVEMGRRVTRRVPLHTVDDAQAEGSELRLSGAEPLVITQVEEPAAKWLAVQIREACRTAVELPPEPEPPAALRALTERVTER